MSKAITERKGDLAAERYRPAATELPPSTLADDTPTLARIAGSFGLFLLFLGLLILAINLQGNRTVSLFGLFPMGIGWAVFICMVGVGGLLWNAAADADPHIRRAFLAFGGMWIMAGAVLSLWPKDDFWGAYFPLRGFPSLEIGLLFVVATLRHETDTELRKRILFAVGIGGALLAAGGFVYSGTGSASAREHLVPYTLLTLIVGLTYLWAFVGLWGSDTKEGRLATQVMGGVGLLAFVAALLRSAGPPLLTLAHFTEGGTADYLMPDGLVLMTTGFIYLAVALAVGSDAQLVVMTRRELAAFFTTPIAYIIMFCFAVLAWMMFKYFVQTSLWQEEVLRGMGGGGHAVPQIEPIVRDYLFNIFPIFCVVVVPPVLTMRLLSEEKRSGTLEMLLTTPLNEWAIVVSKFLAALAMFVVVYLPWGLVFIGLRVESGEPFDYRPLLSFFIALVFSGAGFISMGLFFSSLTRNQVAAAVLTSLGMMALTFVVFLKQGLAPDSTWSVILTHISYVDLWANSLQGKLAVRDLLFHLSFAVFWLFLTTKVLESRTWR